MKFQKLIKKSNIINLKENVEIKKSNTYKFFGIRFEMKDEKSLDKNKKA